MKVKSLSFASLLTLTITLVFTNNLYALNVSSVMLKQVTPHVSTNTRNPKFKASNAAPQPQTLGILGLQLSAKNKKRLAVNIKKQLAHRFSRTSRSLTLEKSKKSTLPSQVNLGMSGVPVLNQGAHGTCVTFALTAAIDAIFQKEDYISQLCALEVWQGQNADSYAQNGWEGSNLAIIARQLLHYGIVSKKIQHTGLCSGEKVYDTKNPDNTGHSMSAQVYKVFSEDISDRVFVERIQDERELWFLDMKNQAIMLKKIKEALVQGQRVLIASALAVDYGDIGAVGTYHSTNDTFMLTTAMFYDQNLTLGFHEMLIYGYDDAISYEEDGKRKKGAFIIRNSWGPNMGDQGNYYMTYDYLQTMVLGAARIVDVNKLYQD